MKMHQIFTALASVAVLTLPAAVLADREDGSEREKENKAYVDSRTGYASIQGMAEAMGGLDDILSFQGVQFMVKGSRFEPEQSFKPGGDFVHILDYDYSLVNALSEQASKTEWFHDGRYPFIQQRQFTEIINGDQGAVFGFDTIIAAPEAPMLSTRIGARVKQNLVSSPLAIIHHANQYSDQVKLVGKKYFDGRPHRVVSIPGWDQPILVFIDAETQLPSKAETLEDDSIYGDTRWEVVFSDWTVVNGIKVPTTLTHKINDRIINNEARSGIQLLETLDPAMFSIPDELKSVFNPDQFAWGVRSSQWFNRFLSVGIPFDLDQRTEATLQIVEVGDKIFHIRSLTHNSLVIEMKDYLIVADAPLYDERTQVVLSTIEQRWPDKPVKYLVSSHFHNDHIGGIRGFGAAGATLIVGKGTKDHYETIFEEPHTVFPDVYSSTQNKVKIKTVKPGKDLILTDGIRRVRIFDVKNRHAIGMLMPFVEDANMVFVSDLYNPEFFPAAIPQQFIFWAEDLLYALAAKGLDIQWMVGAHGGVSSYEQFVTQVESSL